MAIKKALYTTNIIYYSQNSINDDKINCIENFLKNAILSPLYKKI